MGQEIHWLLLALPLSERLLLSPTSGAAQTSLPGPGDQGWLSSFSRREAMGGGPTAQTPTVPRSPSPRGRPSLTALLLLPAPPAIPPAAAVGLPEGAAVPACPVQHPWRCRRRSPWEPALSRSCNPPACTCQRAGRSALPRSRKARFGRGRTTSRASGWSPLSFCSGNLSWCLPCGPTRLGIGRAPRYTARSSA